MSLPKWATPAKWMKNAVATNRGWENEKTGEVYKKINGLKDKIDELAPPKKKSAAKTKVEVVETPESGSEESDSEESDRPGELENLTKLELEALGREHGIELDRRKKKEDLISELTEVLPS